MSSLWNDLWLLVFATFVAGFLVGLIVAVGL